MSRMMINKSIKAEILKIETESDKKNANESFEIPFDLKFNDSKPY